MDKDIRYKEMIGYLKESKEFIFINIVTMVFISAFLVSEDLPIIDIFLIIVVWICLLFGFFIINYLKRQRYHKKIEKMLDELDKKYLITDIIEFSQSMEDDFYYHIMRICNKAMLDEIYQEKRERLEYKEYIEQWIHDIKNPLATVKLICDNNRSEATTKILIETSRINNYIEQALYYARSANVEKDYLIREVLLSEIISKVLVKNKQFLIENGTHILMNDCNNPVLTDEKWLEFIVMQIINNAVQYKSNDILELKICSIESNNGVKLIISDNGIGILESDIPRIFDKGYTGRNGRKNNSSTGLGLYLCKKLCDKLSVDISIESEIGRGTKVTLLFQRGNILRMQA